MSELSDEERFTIRPERDYLRADLRWAANRLEAELDNFPMGGAEDVAWAIGQLRQWADDIPADAS